jgi:hypothetical protein
MFKEEPTTFLTAQTDPSPRTFSNQTLQHQFLEDADPQTVIEVKPLSPGSYENKSSVAANLTLRYSGIFFY